jgi:hypothetical protein
MGACDAGIQERNGSGVAQRLREKPEFKDLLLCALTGFSPSEGPREHPRQADFDHHFVKPIDLKRLLEVFALVAPKGS